MPTRRDFLSTTATLAAASQLAPHLLGAEGADKAKLGFALVGLGRLSTNQIAPALQKTERCELVAIVTGSPEKARKWQDQYGISEANTYNYRNFGQIADNPAVDVIYVVLPNAMHERFTIWAAQCGKHVLCEKPMAVSSDECRRMIAACDEAQVQLAVGYRCQFEPHHLECLRMARERELGKIHLIDAGFSFRIEDFPIGDLRRWRLEFELAGGGALMDVGIYALQACRLMAGEEPVSVMAREIKTDPVKFAEVDETILWNMEFPSGIVANCSTSYNFNGVNRFRVYADRGQFGLDPAYSYGGIQGTVGNRPLEKPQIDQFAAEMDDFARVIQEGGSSKVSGQEGLRDLMVLEAIYESVTTGQRVDI